MMEENDHICSKNPNLSEGITKIHQNITKPVQTEHNPK